MNTYIDGREQIFFEAVQKFLRVLQVFLPLQQLAQPGETAQIADVKIFAFLVAPVGRDSFLGDAMHLMAANLDLDALAVGADHAGVQRLIHVRLGERDIILKTAGHRAPLGVDDAERLVTFPRRVD